VAVERRVLRNGWGWHCGRGRVVLWWWTNLIGTGTFGTHRLEGTLAGFGRVGRVRCVAKSSGMGSGACCSLTVEVVLGTVVGIGLGKDFLMPDTDFLMYYTAGNSFLEVGNLLTGTDCLGGWSDSGEDTVAECWVIS
jgi:hypothetical protein